jgi:hypothetical protein
MKQFFPGAVTGGAARSLGTRVVTFKVQNGKLYVFDVDDRKKTSDTFDPQVVVEAYPIIDLGSFSSMSGASDYVLFDPGAGLNRFNAVSDVNGSSNDNFKIELLFNQRFRKIGDGVTYEQVFTGYSEIFGSAPQSDIDGNALRGQGTMGVALRRYQEGPGFTTRPYPEKPYYFPSDVRIVPNTGDETVDPIKWNIYRGMKPIKWTISYHAKETQDLPQYKDYDVLGALKHGVEDWNAVFGFPVFEAEVGAPDDSYADDDKNYVLWDTDPSYGAAFANWRTNPNTGEIRGASVYMNMIWLSGADEAFEDDPPATPTGRVPFNPLKLKTKARPKTAFLTWYGMPNSTTCTLWAPQYQDGMDQDTPAGDPGTAAATAPLTKKQKVFNYLKNTLLHEVGHNLGLRHNFKGSLAAPLTNSIMDYTVTDTDTRNPGVGAYDIQAIKYLYGLSEDKPTLPFCTDENTVTDPTCNRFDTGADPFKDFFAPAYDQVVSDYVTGANDNPPNNTLNRVLQFVRAGSDSATKVAAFNRAIAGARVLGAGETRAAGAHADRVDDLAHRVLQRLFLDAVNLRGDITMDPTMDAALSAPVLVELRGNLMNADGIRSYATRRLVVDILKKLQTADALSILKDAQADLQAKRATLTGADANQADDLLARIAKATSPYFN